MGLTLSGRRTESRLTPLCRAVPAALLPHHHQPQPANPSTNQRPCADLLTSWLARADRFFQGSFRCWASEGGHGQHSLTEGSLHHSRTYACSNVPRYREQTYNCPSRVVQLRRGHPNPALWIPGARDEMCSPAAFRALQNHDRYREIHQAPSTRQALRGHPGFPRGEAGSASIHVPMGFFSFFCCKHRSETCGHPTSHIPRRPNIGNLFRGRRGMVPVASPPEVGVGQALDYQASQPPSKASVHLW